MSDAVRIHQLRERVKLAQALGFTDDVEHWSEELGALEEKGLKWGDS